MTTEDLHDLMERASTLTPEEQKWLIEHLAERIRAATTDTKPLRKWAEICGAAPYPLLGEDAQAYVSRTRREDTESRERQCRK